MKTYILTLSQVFQKGHPEAGQPTGFKEKFLAGKKIHTIRANYQLWLKRFKEISDGKACLSIRQWSDKPYRSKQIEIARLTQKDGIGIEQVILPHIANLTDVFHAFPGLDTNDGLTREQWLEWFKDYKAGEPMAIIHFTKFRYFQKHFKTPEFGGIKTAIPMTASGIQKPLFGIPKPQDLPDTEETFKQAMEKLTDEEHFRYLYMPYMVTDVYFDYVDTVLTLAAQMRIEPLKKVCRLVKETEKDYRYFMRQHIDHKHLTQQSQHMDIFLDGYFDKFNAEYKIIKVAIRAKKPDLHPDWITFLACIYMTMAIFYALQEFCREADKVIAQKWKPGGRTILLDWVPLTNKMMLECLGDSDVISREDLKTSGKRILDTLHNLKWEGKIIR